MMSNGTSPTREYFLTNQNFMEPEIMKLMDAYAANEVGLAVTVKAGRVLMDIDTEDAT